MMRERREARRTAILGNLPGEVLISQPMAVREIGIDGVTVETTFPLHLDSLHELRMMLDTHSVVLRARVVHAHITDVDQDAVVYRSGLEFIDAPPHVRAVIEAYVAALHIQRQGT